MRLKAVRVHVVSFGPWRNRLPQGGEWREVPDETRVADLLAEMATEGHFESPMLQAAAVAVNREYVGRSTLLREGDELAILPPVSGGSGESSSCVRLVRECIDTEAVLRALKQGSDGAVCAFDGIVRDNTRGRRTLHLDYEAYEAMALEQMQALRSEAIGRFAVRDVAIVHRLGHLLVGETSVFIAVASAHRGPAFEACRWVIDTLKKTVPIWKLEQFADGAAWADGEPFPEEIAGAPR